MKKNILISIVTLFSLSLFAQDFDHLMTKKQIDCSDVSYNSSLIFIKYVNENKNDSAENILKYWEAKCGQREPIFRAKTLLALKTGQFNDTILSKGALNHIFNYIDRTNVIKNSNMYEYDNYKAYYGYIQPGQEFDNFTKLMASELKENYAPESIEYLITEFYSDNTDELLTKIQTNTYKETSLANNYYEVVKYYKKLPETHISWITGLWMPTGALRQVGMHPELGFQSGVKHNKMNYDLTMTFKFLNSPNQYYAKRPQNGTSPELTNHFFGGYIGLDIGRDILVFNGNELQLTGGIALDGFDALREDTNNNLKSASTFTYNMNFGVSYRYYITNEFYLGLRAKYNIADYSLSRVIDFTGNAITLQFIIGGVTNPNRSDNLQRLKYRLRK
ncbi:hypothetical protein MASR2M117_09680 [Paludibacter sp.]